MFSDSKKEKECSQLHKLFQHDPTQAKLEVHCFIEFKILEQCHIYKLQVLQQLQCCFFPGPNCEALTHHWRNFSQSDGRKWHSNKMQQQQMLPLSTCCNQVPENTGAQAYIGIQLFVASASLLCKSVIWDDNMSEAFYSYNAFSIAIVNLMNITDFIHCTDQEAITQ